MRRYHVWLAVGGLAALTSLPASLAGQGYSVNEHSTCAMGRAGTAVAAPCADGSAMVYNPAGLAALGKGHGVLTAGATFIRAGGGFTNDITNQKDDLEKKTIPVPAVYAAYGLSDRFAAGIGLFAPYGLETNWKPSAQGRFLGYKSVIRNIYIQPTLAVRVSPRIDIGAGFDYNLSHVQLRQHQDLSVQAVPAGLFPPNVQTFADVGVIPGTDFTDVNLTGDSHSYGYHAGIIVRPVDRLSFGVRYLSRQKTDIDDGTVKFSQINTNILLGGLPLDQLLAAQFQSGATLGTQSASTSLRLPEQWTFGAAADISSDFKLLADVTTTNWSVFDTLTIVLQKAGTIKLAEDYNRTWAYRIGGEYALSSSTVLRLGYINHGGAAPPQTVTPNLPEGPRAEFTGGLGTTLGKSLHVDLAYQYIDQGDRRGRIQSNPLLTDGLYTFNAHLFGATFTYSF